MKNLIRLAAGFALVLALASLAQAGSYSSFSQTTTSYGGAPVGLAPQAFAAPAPAYGGFGAAGGCGANPAAFGAPLGYGAGFGAPGGCGGVNPAFGRGFGAPLGAYGAGFGAGPVAGYGGGGFSQTTSQTHRRGFLSGFRRHR